MSNPLNRNYFSAWKSSGHKLTKYFAVVFSFIMMGLFSNCELAMELINQNLNTNSTATNTIIVTVTSPTNGESIPDTYEVIGSAYGSAGLLNGSVYFCLTNNTSTTNTAVFSFLGEKMESFRKEITIPTNGIYYLWTKVFDSTGQSLNSPPILVLADGSINYTNTLSLTFTQPTDGYQVTPTFNYTGSAFSSAGLDSLSIHYTLSNGTGITNSVNMDYNGETSLNFATNLTISEDTYSIWLTAYDTAGQFGKSTPIYIVVSNTSVNDTTPPTLTVTAPTNGQTVGSSSTISGTVSEQGGSGLKHIMLQINSGGFKPVSTIFNSWSTNVSFASAGSYIIDVYAIDNATNSSTTNSLTVTSDPGLVSISITTPTSGILTNLSSIRISGSASVEGSTLSAVEVNVNNAGYTSTGVTGTSSWTADITLTEGSNIITARGISASGKTNESGNITVLLDTTAPTLTITDPTNGQVIADMVSYTTRGTASDTLSGIKEVYIAIDSQSYALASGTTNWNLGNTYSIGTHDIHAYAVDNQGNISLTNTISIELTTSDSTAPTLTISYPSNNNTTSSSLTATGTASDNNAVLGVYVKLNSGSFQQATGTNSWFKTYTLTDGVNTIYAYAKDVSGNISTTNSATITYNQPTGMTVYFKKPSTWTTGGVYIHYWGGPTGTTNTDWGSCPECTSEGNDWYSFTFGDRTNTSLLFKNQSSSNNTTQSADLSRVGTGYYYTDNKWYDSDPDGTQPVLNISSPSDGRVVTSESIYVSGTAAGGTTAVKLSVNGGAYASATGTDSWTYQASLAMGTNSISVYATNSSTGQASGIQYRMVIRKEATGDTYPGSYTGDLGATLFGDGVQFAIHWRTSIVSAVYVTGDFNGWSQTALTHEGNNEWSVFIPGAVAGDEYLFVGTKTGGDVSIADPYSEYNRYSSGNSVVVDQDAYTWNDSSWSRPGWGYYTIYEMHVKDFTQADTSVSTANRGKYLGITEKLDYLTNLGITAIELMPPSEFPDAGYSWGYNTSLFMAVESGYATDPASGQLGVDEFKEMVDMCHQYGIAVIVDMVFNHTANNDNWLWAMDDVLYFDYDNDGTVEAQSGGDDATPWGNKLATWKDEVKRFGKDTIEYFMTELHVDGFRFDATHQNYMSHDFLRDLKTYASSLDPNVFFSYENLPNEVGLKTYGAQWSDPYHDDGVDLFSGYNSANLSWMHNKIRGSEDWAYSPYECVNYVESHDEDSLGYHAFTVNGWDSGLAKARSRAMVVMLAGSLGHPMILMGQEFLRDKEGQNTEDAANTLDWTLADSRSDLVSYYGGVLRTRRDYDAMRTYDGSKFSWVYEPNGANKAAWRLDGTKDAVVMLNLNWTGSTDLWLPAGTWIKIVNEGEAYTSTTMADVVSGGQNISVGANSGVIFVEQ